MDWLVLDMRLVPSDVDPWTFILLGGFSMMLTAAGKAGFGGSLGLLSVPLMIYACSGRTAVALGLMLPLLIACDYLAVIGWWRKWNWRIVLLLLPGTLLGLGAAWGAMHLLMGMGADGEKAFTDAVLQLTIGLISLLFVGLQIWRARGRNPKAFAPDLRHGSGLGLAAGMTSTFAHAAGPVIAMYMLPQQMAKGQYVASTVVFFWILNQLKLVPYFSLGMISPGSLFAGLSLLPAVMLGTVAGLLLHRRVSQEVFSGVVYSLLALAGVHLIYQAIEKLL